MSITVEIIEHATPALKRLELGLKTGAANQEIGRAVVGLVQDHLVALPPNQRHFPTTSFWQRAAEATGFDADSEGVRVSIDQIGVRQRLLGGPIDPVRGKFLAVPAIAETYGRSAADFSDLKVVRGMFTTYTGRVTALALVPKDWKANAASPGGSSGVYFWLLRHVSQQPNPDVLPGDDEILETGLAAARGYLARLHSGGGNN